MVTATSWPGTIPNCITYDPTFQYEVAVIVHNGLKRMYEDQEDVYFYLTLMNENYSHPDMPMGVEEGIIKGLYRFKDQETGQEAREPDGLGHHSGAGAQSGRDAEEDFGVTSDIWSATSFNELARDCQDAARANRLNPLADPKVPYITEQLAQAKGPIIARPTI